MKTKFKTSQQNLERLFECNRESAKVWNDSLKVAKEYYLEHHKWIGKTDLQKATKQKYQLHSQSIQAVCHKYLFARDAAKEARQSGFDNKYPYKQKKYYNTKWAKDGFGIYPNGKIELSMGIQNHKRQAPIVLHIAKVPEGEIKEIELIYDRGLQISLSYEDKAAIGINHGLNLAAIDPGEIHSIAAVCENQNGIIITGRKIRSIKRLRNKKLAELQRKMSNCQKGSRQWKKYHRAKQYLLSKSDAQIKDAVHKTTKNFVKWCLENEVKHVVIGDVEGVQRNTSKRKKKNQKIKSKLVNQKLSQWQFGLIYTYLVYKLAVFGITISKENERYTTQQCPCCGKKKKPSSRNYKCQCGYQEHRDIHGAKNLLSRYKYGEITDIGKILQTKYLRVA